ncbi:hypothetical protein [Burkholderia vietnamiensis]|uniref:hypothetical protein n=1 Tax=Burkholderia vietnamiensis TaxID=60552 RepID=UPI001CF5A897|nr:hypothetical protein [Burkholderia vietnamiensis]MCA8448956.1 hypothetical protein [Burkholderia vietnamiensis]
MNERLFDLDDVRALGAAFTPEELRWATLPRAWKDAAPLDDPEHAEFSGLSFRELTQHSWRPGTVPTTWQLAEQEMYFSRTWHATLKAAGVQTKGSAASRNVLQALDRRFDALVAKRAHKGSGRPFTALEACWLNDREEHILDRDENILLVIHTLEHPGEEVGIIWSERVSEEEIMQRKAIYEESLALRAAADQAMAKQNDPPVRRQRARL